LENYSKSLLRTAFFYFLSLLNILLPVNKPIIIFQATNYNILKVIQKPLAINCNSVLFKKLFNLFALIANNFETFNSSKQQTFDLTVSAEKHKNTFKSGQTREQIKGAEGNKLLLIFHSLGSSSGAEKTRMCGYTRSRTRRTRRTTPKVHIIFQFELSAPCPILRRPKRWQTGSGKAEKLKGQPTK